jgi:hypothetical protein
MDRAQRLGRRHPEGGREVTSSSNLIDRYMAAIARELPDAQRVDITAELRDALMSRIEAKEEALSRPLTRDELEAELIAFGNPLSVAGRYRKTQHLIGPDVFPFWWAGLRAALLIVGAVYLVLAILAVVGGADTASLVDKASPSLSVALVFTFGAVTLVCAAIERFGKPGMLMRFRPSQLPPVKGRSRRRFEILVELLMGFAALLWWLGVLRFSRFMPLGSLQVELASVWTDWFWPIAIYFAAEMAMNLTALLRPAWVRLNSSLMIVRNLVAATVLATIQQTDRLVDVSSTSVEPEVLAQIQANFDRGMHIGVAVAIAIFLILAAIEAWRLVRHVRMSRGVAAPA